MLIVCFMIAELGGESPRKRKRDKGSAFAKIGSFKESMSDIERRQLQCERVRSSSISGCKYNYEYKYPAESAAYL